MWIAILLALLALNATVFILRRRRIRRTARKISALNDALFATPHRFVLADPARFPWTDARSYEETRRDLEAEGFLFLGNVEDETLSSLIPANRTYSSLLRLEDGSVRASVAELVIGGAQGRASKRFRVIELNSELSDGSCVTTSTAPPRLLFDPPASVSRLSVTPDMPLREMVAAHRTLLERVREARRPVTIVPVRSLDEHLAAWQRSLDRRHTRARAGPSLEELRRLAPPGHAGVADDVHAEIQRQRERW